MVKKIVISSSMKYPDLIRSAMKTLGELGYIPLFPNFSSSFQRNEAELTVDVKNELAKHHYAAIDSSDAVYFILPNGYMGTSCKLELGYAFALKKPIYFSELTNDNALDGYPKKIISLDNLIEFHKEFEN